MVPLCFPGGQQPKTQETGQQELGRVKEVEAYSRFLVLQLPSSVLFLPSSWVCWGSRPFRWFSSSFPPESRYGWLPSSFRCQRSRCVLACDVQALYLVDNVQLWFSRILTGQFQKCGQWEWRQPLIESESLKDPCQRTRLDFLSHIPFQIRLEGAAEFDLPAFTIIYLSIHEKAAPDFRELPFPTVSLLAAFIYTE